MVGRDSIIDEPITEDYVQIGAEAPAQIFTQLTEVSYDA